MRNLEHGAWIPVRDLDRAVDWMLQQGWYYQFDPRQAVNADCCWVVVYCPRKAMTLTIKWGTSEPG